MGEKRMPIGVDDFAKLRTNDFYYVDKTGMIKELLENWGEVNLFTRPRRFGKSLNMSMLQNFFEIGADRHLFDGLSISNETRLCEEYMGQYPVISLSLKQVSGDTMAEAKENLWEQIMLVADHLNFLLESDKISFRDRGNIRGLCSGSGNLAASLKQLSEMLYKHYGKKVIILIDEYDAPLQKAFENGYFDDMVKQIRQLFGYALKSNEFLFFSVLTGCMRVSKESIFSDLNNPDTHSMLDSQFGEWFGFTDEEVRRLLNEYGLQDFYQITKDWYDGYYMGKTQNIYCPWDVVKWCKALMNDRDAVPENYWANVSENGIVYQFINMADEMTRCELEELSRGECVNQEISPELTYKDIGESIDNLWSVLFTTGYLTQRGRNEDGTWRLAIPNREVRNIFDRQIKIWFRKRVEGGLPELYKALDIGEPDIVERCINDCLKESISFMDGGNTKEEKESFYHGLLLGMLRGRRGWVIKSNREAGNGRADIILTDREGEKGVIIEVKYADDLSDLKAKAQEGLDQANDRRYGEYFIDSGVESILQYGIAFRKKNCKVVKGDAADGIKDIINQK
ncbi:MAG: ATP-binding protein [Lachnospiraceae bacterium]|nr:ATP-binding protein [Lachnospiraceae bacterium]